MNVREYIENEISAMELNPKVISKMNDKVKNICISILFEDNSCIVLTPNDIDDKKRLFLNINEVVTNDIKKYEMEHVFDGLNFDTKNSKYTEEKK